MWRKPINQDEQTQDSISSITRRWTRKTWLNRISQNIALILAKILINPREDVANISFLSGACAPPHGQFCSGCGADGSCPSTYVTCTTNNSLNGCKALCPHPSGWWYTSDPVGLRAKCMDCVSQYVHPYSGNTSCYKGAQIAGQYVICGCKSTVLY